MALTWHGSLCHMRDATLRKAQGNEEHGVTVCFLAFRITNHTMERSPIWEADSQSASRGIQRLLWNSLHVEKSFLRNCHSAQLVKKFHAFYGTHSMEQSPSWEANSYSASQEIPRLLWNSLHGAEPFLRS
jgi:hypothetical protein